MASATDPALLLRSDQNGIATLMFNRPAQYNALSSALLIELQAALDAIARDAGVTAIELHTAAIAVFSLPCIHASTLISAHPNVVVQQIFAVRHRFIW